jgi:biotin synthase-like enzyme
MKTLTKEEIIAIAKFAFKAGENWGVTYSGWYEPTKEDREQKINGVVEQIIEFNELEN